MVQKERLDKLLVERNLVESRSRAQRLIMAGEVLVNDRVMTKAGMQVPVDAAIKIRERMPYVGRGGYKLAGALDEFQFDPTGMIVADVGASTGGFTDVLLQRGAARVYAIDVGYGQLAWKLRQDPRVVVMERTNARHLTSLPERVDLAVIDASFISLRLLLPAVQQWLKAHGDVIALVKPQFEAGREQVGKGGVIRDPAIHRQVLADIIDWSRRHDWRVVGVTASSIRGPAGNVEFFLWLTTVPTRPELDAAAAIERALAHVPEDA